MKLNKKTYYTTRDIAKLTGLTVYGVRGAIERGDLKATKFNNAFIITKEDLEEYIAKRETRGESKE